MMQDTKDIVIADTQACDVLPDDSTMNAPSKQQIALVERDVFVQQVHAASGRRVGRPCSSSKALRASWTASVIAAFDILPPPQRCRMKSQERPRSTSASTSATKTLVPLKVSLP